MSSDPTYYALKAIMQACRALDDRDPSTGHELGPDDPRSTPKYLSDRLKYGDEDDG